MCVTNVSNLWRGMASRTSHASELKNWMPKHSQKKRKKKKILRHPVSSREFYNVCSQQILIRLLILTNFRLSFFVSKNKRDVRNIDVVNRVILYA